VIDGSFNDLVLEINKHEPSESFANTYFESASKFLSAVKIKREELIQP